MESLPLISVIVPIYKVEQYLYKCVNSIVNQTYCNLEIILVDDGSPDNCPAICDEYAKKDTRIKVIHKDNGGLSDARNVGIEIAKGEYIGFVDSDDYIENDMYELLYSLIYKTGSDIAVCNYYLVENEIAEPNPLNLQSPYLVLDCLEAVKEIFIDKEIESYAWNKLYKSELFESIRYPVGKYFEDIYTTYKLVLKSKSVVISNVPMYFYLQRNDSICHRLNEKILIDHFDAIKSQQSYIQNNYPKLSYICTRYCSKKIIIDGIGIYGFLFRHNMLEQNHLLVDLNRQFLTEYLLAGLINKCVPVNYKIALVLYVWNETLYREFRKVYIKHRKSQGNTT